MDAIENEFLQAQLVDRREKLQTALSARPGDPALARLLNQVDTALGRMGDGSYGLCETCHDTIEKDRLLADPLVCVCLDHLSPEERRALERDLELAGRVQRGLLPPEHLSFSGWRTHYHYAPLGPVSGDYCDVIHPEKEAGDLLFVVGDVSGKGVAASMLMTQLHAIFRSLNAVGLPLGKLLELANRVLCESTLAGHYATLVCGRAGRDGQVEIASAGHLPVLVLRDGTVARVEATGVPLGMFCEGEFAVQRVALAPGQSLLLYTDGLVEARDSAGAEYGLSRLEEVVCRHRAPTPDALTAACLRDLHSFAGSMQPLDDLTLLAIQRTE